MLTNKQVPAQKPALPLRQTYKMHFNLFVFVHMAEKKVQKTKVQSDYLSDSKTSEEEVNPQLCTSEEERIYGMIKGSAQATQAVLSHARAQSNPTVERGPPRQPKIKKLSKEWAFGKATQTKDKEKPL